MARKKDLAGLATLAGLAYMASRDKEAGSEKEYRADPYGEMTQEQRDARPDMNGRTLAEENYGNESRHSLRTPSTGKPAAPKASTPKPMGGSGRGGRGGATAEELAAYDASKPKKLQYQSLQDRARAYEEERAKSGVGMYGTRKSEPREPLPTASDMAYKKGGSVKGWGMARGARKAKTY